MELAATQKELTPIQRFVYTLAKDHHTEEYSDEPTGMNKAHGATKGF